MKNINHKLCLVLVVLLQSINSFSQDNDVVDSDAKAYSKNLSEEYVAHYESFLENLRAQIADRKTYKYVHSRYERIFTMLNEEIAENRATNIPEVSDLIKELLTEIRNGNPSVPDNISVLILRENIPNAYTLGDNVIFINTGLFYYMNSEDNIAAVLCHEIGHILLKHSLKAMIYNYQKDKENVDDVKSVRNKQINKTDYALRLLKNTLYEGWEQKREHEKQADSIGYELYKNTSYRRGAFTEAIEVLDRYDTLSNDDVDMAVYKQFFDLPKQAFKDKWLESEDFSSYNYDGYKPMLDEDSTSSHPEGIERITYLENLYPESESGATVIDSMAQYNVIRTLAGAQVLPNLYFNERYGEIVYICLAHLSKYPEDELHRYWMGKSLQRIYEARRDYQLNKYLETVSPKEQTESYMRFLSFMWNLKLEELKMISEYYAPDA